MSSITPFIPEIPELTGPTVAQAIVELNAGDVGTYIYASGIKPYVYGGSPSVFNLNELKAGTDLFPCGLSGSTVASRNHRKGYALKADLYFGNSQPSLVHGNSLSGIWRCMGQTNAFYKYHPITLFLRVS